MSKGIVLALSLITIIIFSAVSVLSLEVKKTPVQETAIREIDDSFSFDFEIKNTNLTDTFEIYTLVGGITFFPKEPFIISGGQTKKLRVEIHIPESTRQKISGPFTFAYHIKGENTGKFNDQITVRIIPLKEAIEIKGGDISIGDNTARFYITNKEDYTFKDIEAEFSSSFFQFSDKFDLEPYEKKELIVDINKENIGKLTAGRHLVKGKIKFKGIEAEISGDLNFIEKKQLETTEENYGFLINTHRIIKKNNGNIITTTSITVEKNIISRLFTSFNIIPDKVEREGTKIKYIWSREVSPSETFEVVVRTNWIFPFLILIIIILSIIFVKKKLASHLILRKRAVYVKTKSGDFALKIILSAEAKKPMSNISIIDKIPPLVNLHEKFGEVEPDRIDKKNKRLEYNIPHLNPNEKRIFSYIVYTKIRVIGKFEVPPATAVYEIEDKIHETKSNRVFFITKQVKKE